MFLCAKPSAMYLEYVTHVFNSEDALRKPRASIIFLGHHCSGWHPWVLNYTIHIRTSYPSVSVTVRFWQSMQIWNACICLARCSNPSSNPLGVCAARMAATRGYWYKGPEDVKCSQSTRFQVHYVVKFRKMFLYSKYTFRVQFRKMQNIPSPVSVSIPEDAHVGCGPPIPYSMYFRIAIYIYTHIICIYILPTAGSLL